MLNLAPGRTTNELAHDAGNVFDVLYKLMSINCKDIPMATNQELRTPTE